MVQVDDVSGNKTESSKPLLYTYEECLWVLVSQWIEESPDTYRTHTYSSPGGHS